MASYHIESGELGDSIFQNVIIAEASTERRPPSIAIPASIEASVFQLLKIIFMIKKSLSIRSGGARRSGSTRSTKISLRASHEGLLKVV